MRKKQYGSHLHSCCIIRADSPEKIRPLTSLHRGLRDNNVTGKKGFYRR